MGKKTVAIIFAIVCILALAAVVSITLRNDSEKALEIESESGIEEKVVLPEQEALTFYFNTMKPSVTREILDYVESKALEKLNIKLNFEFIPELPEAYISKIKNIISSGNPCDAFAYSDYYPTSLKVLAESNVAKDITDLFPRYAQVYYNTLAREERNAASSEGRIYAIPKHYPATQMMCATVRQDLMKKYNISEIASYDDYEGFLHKIKNMERGIVPAGLNETSLNLFAEANGYIILDADTGLVYKWDDTDMRIEPWEQTSAFKKSIETLQKWSLNEYFLKNSAPFQIDENTIASGNWASFISTLGSDIIYNTIAENHGKDWMYKSYPLYTDKVSTRLSSMDGALVISESTLKPDKVLLFIDWLQSNQENYETLMCGIKNKHYILENDKIKLPEGIKIGDSLYGWGWRNAFINLEFERVGATSDAELLKEYKDIINSNTKYPGHMGFLPDYSSVAALNTQRKSAINLAEIKIHDGVFSQEDLENYINEQKAIGINQLVNVIQKQLDQWKALNMDRPDN